MTRLLRTGALVVAVTVEYNLARRWFLTWGATEDEIEDDLPGDELIDAPTMVATRAVTIEAPPETVWPWLVQMGQDRGGLYSYDWLENLAGLQFHSADRIVPEWQTLGVGDQIRAAPSAVGPDAGFTVVRIEPPRTLILAVGDPDKVLADALAGKLPTGGTWAFLLRPYGHDKTRLVVRFRSRFGLPAVPETALARMVEIVHFVMERRQLLGIKERAERLWAEQADVTVDLREESPRPVDAP